MEIMKSLFLRILGLLSLILFAQSHLSGNDELKKFTDKFLSIYQIANQYHLDTLDFEELTDKALEFILKEMDPDSKYYSTKAYTEIKNKRQGKKHGIGVSLININDTAAVFHVHDILKEKGYRIKPGDRVLFINGNSISGENINNTYTYLNGELGEEVALIYKSHLGSRLEEEKFVRMATPDPSVDLSYVIDGTNIGYLKLNRFSFVSSGEYFDAMDKLIASGMKSLVLDLRDNPGGSYKDARDVTASFLAKGKQFNSTKARHQEFKLSFATTEDGKYKDLPVVVLMNRNSASGCEVLAGTLQDYDRCIIVGEKSFGKGTIQKLWEFKDSSAFKLTVGKYLTPLGRSIHKEKKDVRLDAGSELNLKDSIKKKILDKMSEYGSKLPVYKTEGGKSLLGGGGIWPDYTVRIDTSTKLVFVLKQKHIFNEYVYNYIKANIQKLQNDYGINHNKFVSSFNVSDEMLMELKKLSYSKNIWNEEMFQADKDYIRNYLKALIAHALWGKQASDMILHQNDRAIEEAVNRMEEAKQLIK